MPSHMTYSINPLSSHYDVEFPPLPVKWKKITASMILPSGESLHLRLDSRITQSEFYELVKRYLHRTPENLYITVDHLMICRDMDQKSLHPYGLPLSPVTDEIFHLRVEPYQPPRYSVHFSWEADLMDTEKVDSYISSELAIYESYPSVHDIFPTEKCIYSKSYAIRRPFQDDNPSVFTVYRMEDIEILRMYFTKSCDWGYIRIPDQTRAMIRMEDLFVDMTKCIQASPSLLEKMNKAYQELINN
jgi:hypothetical protein